jgi:hypothetical protein
LGRKDYKRKTEETHINKGRRNGEKRIRNK